MTIGLIVSAGLILIIIFIWQLIKYGSKSSPLTLTEKESSPLTNNCNDEISSPLPQDKMWWQALDFSDQLGLAVFLAQKALPVWDKYTRSNDTVYRNSSAGPLVKIDINLLQKSINEITHNPGLHLPDKDNKRVKWLYDQFVGPVVALQDGNWVTTYPVKKIFLAVYNIVKSISDQANIPGTKILLTTSINQSLDCMDVSKLYSPEEIAYILESYKIE